MTVSFIVGIWELGIHFLARLSSARRSALFFGIVSQLEDMHFGLPCACSTFHVVGLVATSIVSPSYRTLFKVSSKKEDCEIPIGPLGYLCNRDPDRRTLTFMSYCLCCRPSDPSRAELLGACLRVLATLGTTLVCDYLP